MLDTQARLSLICAVGPITRREFYTILDQGAHAGTLGAALQRFFLAVTALSTIGVVILLDSAESSLIRNGAIIVEGAALSVYIVEYALRLWCAPEDLREKGKAAWKVRLGHALSSAGLLDLVVIGLIAGHLFGAPFAQILGALSLLRLLKIGRYSLVLKGISSTLGASRQLLWACLMLIVAVGCIAGCIVFLVERDSQPEVFGKLSNSIWWTLSSLAGSGKTDVGPESATGQFIAMMLGLFGYMIVALPMGIISGIFHAKSQERQFIVTWSMVARVPFFQALAPAHVLTIIEKLRSERFAAGQTILRKGDKGDLMYFLLEGEVTVIGDFTPFQLGTGQYFGERALITKEPRSATIRAVTPVKLLSLASADLADVLDAHPVLLEQLKSAIDAQEK